MRLHPPRFGERGRSVTAIQREKRHQTWENVAFGEIRDDGSQKELARASFRAGNPRENTTSRISRGGQPGTFGGGALSGGVFVG